MNKLFNLSEKVVYFAVTIAAVIVGLSQFVYRAWTENDVNETRSAKDRQADMRAFIRPSRSHDNITDQNLDITSVNSVHIKLDELKIICKQNADMLSRALKQQGDFHADADDASLNSEKSIISHCSNISEILDTSVLYFL